VKSSFVYIKHERWCVAVNCFSAHNRNQHGGIVSSRGLTRSDLNTACYGVITLQVSAALTTNNKTAEAVQEKSKRAASYNELRVNTCL
jgi:hypothetical protein